MVTRILVVDDSPVEQRVVGRLLEKALTDVVVVYADNGQQALDTLSAAPPDLIFHPLAKERLEETRFAARRVRLAATMSTAELRLVISDEGPGFKPSGDRDPTDRISIDRIGGRGLLLIRRFMDEVRHSPRGNEIAMVKRAS